MKKLFLLTTLIMVLLQSLTIYSQQWSSEQKDVWAGVEKYWEINNNDPLADLKYFDDSYLGWSYESETPGTRDGVVKYKKYFSTKQKQQFNILTPAKIWVNGDFAFVHYYYTQVSENSEGKPNTEKGRWTDILMKKNGTWVLVGDHGGEIKNDD
jgi:ketosteroid isomerase-like protein